MSNLPKSCPTAGRNFPTTPIKICGGDGTGKPHFSIKSGIWFNGDQKKGLDNETFIFNPINDADFEFCKTARKPYDFVVCCVLISLVNRMRGFTMSSDGDIDDWEPAIEFYEKMIGKIDVDKISKEVYSKEED
jgi:hypothetical protein